MGTVTLWKHSDVTGLLKVPRGKLLKTCAFELGDLLNFCLAYSPTGCEDCPTGKAGLWICCDDDDDAYWRVRLSIDGDSREVDNYYRNTGEWIGYRDHWSVPDKSAKMVSIRVELLESSRNVRLVDADGFLYGE